MRNETGWKWMKRWLASGAVATGVTLFLLVAACADQPETGGGSEMSQPALARVNGRDITESDLDLAIKVMSYQNPAMANIKTDEDMKQVRKAVLQQLVSKELLYSEAQKLDLKDKDKMVQAGYDEVLARFGTETAFMESLKERGVTREWFMKELEAQVLIQALVKEKVRDQVTVSNEQAREFYEKQKDKFVDKEKVHASHILIRVESDASDDKKAEAKKKIDSLRERALNGEDFNDLAAANSEDPSAQSNRGDLGFFPRGVMVPEFEKAAFELEPGKVSDVIETPFGYHIIKVAERQDEREVSFEEAKPRLKEYLKDAIAQDMLGKYIDSLRADAKIEMFME